MDSLYKNTVGTVENYSYEYIPEYSYMAGLGSFIIVINSITINCSFDIIIILYGIQNIVLVCRPNNCP